VAANAGERLEAGSATAGLEADDEGTIRPLDFSHPTKFTTELRRRVAGALTPFCDALSGGFSAQLNTEVVVELGEITQSSWAGARAGLPADVVAVAVQADRPSHGMLLSVEQPLVLQALECLLGGKADQAPPSRHLSKIDWTLATGLLDTAVSELSAAWVELGGHPLRRGELDLDGDAGITVGATEPTLIVRLTSTVDGCPSGMWLLAPWGAVEPIAERHGPAVRDGALPPSAAGLRDGLSAAQVLLRAEIGSVQMPIERMLAIEPGAVVELGEQAEHGVRLYAEEVSVGRGRPGRSGTRKAIKLLEADAQPVRAAGYAKLGRGELERARAHAVTEAQRPRSPSILRSIFVRVWAELGRTHIALGSALELAPGAVVELDQAAEQPIELFANGQCFASGRLVVTTDGTWGVTVEQLM
jgi:flagellar motor switch protein FliM